MTAPDPTQPASTAADWERSALPHAIVAALQAPASLADLAERLGVTDARIQWYLIRLAAQDRVRDQDGRWTRGSTAADYLATSPAGDGQPFLPQSPVYDLTQAFADSAAGLFGPDFVQATAEHGGRLSTARAAEFRDRLMSLIAEYFAPGRADREGTKYGLHWALTPVDLHPLDDD